MLPFALEGCYNTPTGFNPEKPRGEERIAAALISVYRQKGMIDQAQKLAAGLAGPAFEAYKSKLQKDTPWNSMN
jgi:hypothetical protein